MFDSVFRRVFGGATPDAPPRGAPAPGGNPDLLLYKFDSCPYCRRVMQSIDRLGLEVPMADTRRDAGARDRLVQLTGRSQVPCLFIDGQPLFESADIDAWLRAHKAAQP
jgi:glutaredoxin